MTFHLATSRPRVLGWLKSAAILDGDWGTSIAYVLGIGFTLAGYTSFWHLVMMLGLTTLVAVNYTTICKLYPNGGGVYSSVYHRSKLFAVVGALLLTADYVITASLSVLDSFHYFGIQHPQLWAIGIILLIGVVNWFGPRHSGAVALIISISTLVALGTIVIVSAPHSLTSAHVLLPRGGALENWHVFVGIILSISGIEAISNMTGLMKNPERDSRRAIYVVLTKVVLFTVFLGLAMHAVPNLTEHTEDMIRFLGEHYVGPWFGLFVAAALGMLLISAGNTAINDLVSIQFLMAVDGELPGSLRRLNKHGVPIIPLLIATGLPICVLLVTDDVLTLAHLYAIGVVGAITINLGSTSTDKTIDLHGFRRGLMIVSAAILAVVEISIAIDKPQATLFAAVILAIGLGARLLRKRSAEPARHAVAASAVAAKSVSASGETGMDLPRMLIAVRGGNTKLLEYAAEEAKFRPSMLIIVNVKEVSVGSLPEQIAEFDTRVEDEVYKIMEGKDVPFRFVSLVSYDVGYTLAELAAVFGVNRVLLGVTRRSALEKMLRANVTTTVARLLPEEIQLLIVG